MKNINIAKDIIPIGEFKTGLSRWLKSIQETGQPLVITQNGRPAGVLLSPVEYDDLVQSRAFVESVERGIKDADSDNVYTTKELIKILQEKRNLGGTSESHLDP